MLFLGSTPGEKLPAQTIGKQYFQAVCDSRGELFGHFLLTHFSTEQYQCSGNVESDIPELCALLGIKDIPLVNAKPPASVEAVEEGPGRRAAPDLNILTQARKKSVCRIIQVVIMCRIGFNLTFNSAEILNLREWYYFLVWRVPTNAASRFKKFSAANLWFVPFLEVELENEDPLSTKNLKVAGENKIPQKKCL